MNAFDLHIHSKFSHDSFNSPEKICQRAVAKGLKGIAITDHNCLRVDYRYLRGEFPELTIISGMEISTDIGHILAYCISEEIKCRKATDVIKEIHDKGGIAVLAHPYQQWAPLFRLFVSIKRTLFNKTKNAASLKKIRYHEALLSAIDAVEIANSRNTENNTAAEKLAREYEKPVTAGSDAHFLAEIGKAVLLTNSTRNIIPDAKVFEDTILAADTKAECVSCSSTFPFYASQIVRLSKKIFSACTKKRKYAQKRQQIKDEKFFNSR